MIQVLEPFKYGLRAVAACEVRLFGMYTKRSCVFAVLVTIIHWMVVLEVMGQEMKNELRFKYQYYEDNNGVHVNQPMLKVNQRLHENTAVHGHILIDALSAASRRVFYPLPGTDTASGLKNTRDNNSLSVDAVTGASIREVRGELGGGLIHRHGNTQIGLAGTGSREKDYESLSGSVDIKQDLFGQNSNLTLNYTRFEDKYVPVEELESYSNAGGFYLADSNGAGWGGDRHINSATLGWTQTLSRKSLGMVSLGLTHSQGYLGRPYYLVVVADTTPATAGESGGTPYMEEYPDTRLGGALVLRFRQHYPSLYREGSAQVEYRRYMDTWGLASDTYSLLVNQYLHSLLFLQLRYRYYSQVPVAFYRDRYDLRNVNPGSPGFLSYRTVDARLADFRSHLVQVKLVFLLKNFVKPSTEEWAVFPTHFDIEVERYLRTTHPDLLVRQRRYEFYDQKGLEAWIIRGGFVFSY